MWMFGPMGAVDPDQVDNDAGNVWRNLYKLEKTFGDNPNPQKMAQTVSQQHHTYTLYSYDITILQVKGRVDEFKEHLPLLSALFNPGLRDRHWEKMSEIAGQDLRPNEVSINNNKHQ